MSVAIGQKTTLTPERLLAAAKVLRELSEEPVLGLVNDATYFILTSEQLSELSNRLEPVTPEYRWK